MVRHFCDRVAVLYAGRVVELAPAAELFAHPKHPYTRALLSAVPWPGSRRTHALERPGRSGRSERLPAGCAFHPRCPACFVPCKTQRPALKALPPASVQVACHLHSPAISSLLLFPPCSSILSFSGSNLNSRPNSAPTSAAAWNPWRRSAPPKRSTSALRPAYRISPIIDKTFAVGLTVICKDVAAHNAYQVDPIHLAFIERFRPYWSRVQIYDAE